MNVWTFSVCDYISRIPYTVETVYRVYICPTGSLPYFRTYPVNNTVLLKKDLAVVSGLIYLKSSTVLKILSDLNFVFLVLRSNQIWLNFLHSGVAEEEGVAVVIAPGQLWPVDAAVVGVVVAAGGVAHGGEWGVNPLPRQCFVAHVHLKNRIGQVRNVN